jgi:PAS domain S-box-containing protein
VSLIDISDRKRNEVALQESEERYRTILEDIEEGYQELDLDGNYTYANESFIKILGYAKAELIGMNYRQHTDTENAVRIAQEYAQVYKTGVPLKRYEADIIRKDGVRRIVEIAASLIRGPNGNPKGLRGIMRDVTDQKTIEEQYRTMAYSSQMGVYIIQKGIACFVNPQFPEYLGRREEEILGRNLLDFVHPDDRETVRKKAVLMLKGKMTSPYEYRIIDRNDNIRWLMEKVSPIIYRGMRAVLGNTMDITERRQGEEEKKRLEVQLLQARKMESIGTLAGGIAHDFNNLLMGIQGFTSIMLSKTDRSDPNYEKLRGIEVQVESGANLTKQLLGFARAGRYAIQPTDLNEILKKTSDMFGRTRKEITIHSHYGMNLWPVEVDKGQIEQVLLNLYVNAWQAMPGGGEIYLETRNANLDESYTKEFTIVPGKYVKISVTDTGVGMDDRTKQRIFEPFFTTKEMGRGTGLGLATVYGIVKGHRGIINVYSEKDHGTTFNIYLPASDKELLMDEEESSPQEPMHGKETLFVVDDEDTIRDVTKDLLLDLGYKVLTAGSGREAIDIYKVHKEKIQLVILDMVMPGMGGRETFDILKSVDPHIKVVLSSGYSLNGMAMEILDHGCQSFIQKPFNMVTLSQKIREVLDS